MDKESYPVYFHVKQKRSVKAFAVTFSTVIERLNTCFRNIVYYVESFCNTAKSCK